MKKFTQISLAVLLAASVVAGCNSETVVEENTSSNVAVYSFNLSADDSVLVNLDTVFFSIDLNRGRIFNADSMPYGTRTDKLVPVILTYAAASKATLTVPRANGTDTIHDYGAHPNDTIDFSNGPVILSITSASGTVEYKYSIEVNVHKVKTDSLAWGKTERSTIPSPFATTKTQSSTCDGNKVYMLQSDGNSWSIATHTAPEGAWKTYSAAVPTGANAETFTASNGKLYVCAGNMLYTSSDEGRTWTSTARPWSHIYGAFNSGVVGAYKNGNNWYTEQYPAAGEPTALPSGMPVQGTSNSICATFDLASDPQLFIVGGKTEFGVASADSWCYDGTSWVKLSVTPLSTPLTGMTLVPFYTFSVSNIFVPTEHSVLLAMGGLNSSGANRKVYISYDFGMHWAEAESLLQLPDFIPSFYGAGAYVFTTKMYPKDEAAQAWESYPLNLRIPANADLEYFTTPGSRAIAPVEDWECPYIYLYGGYDSAGKPFNTVWRGTINRLTFKPLQ